jgi:hypothetical protein
METRVEFTANVQLMRALPAPASLSKGRSMMKRALMPFCLLQVASFTERINVESQRGSSLQSTHLCRL